MTDRTDLPARELPADRPLAQSGPAARRPIPTWLRILLIGAALYGFIFGLMLMIEGARGLQPVVAGLRVEGPVNTLGLGWIGAYLVMSGSPVAAAAITLLDQGVLSALEAFTMVSGSRLGASMVVLVIGLVYTLRGHGRRTSTYMGTLSLIVSGAVQALALPVGVMILSFDLMPPLSAEGARLTSVTDLLVGRAVEGLALVIEPHYGELPLFALGLLILIVALSGFDRSLPVPELSKTRIGGTGELFYRPIIMLGFGMLVTLISMSVSVSLSLLVPLSARGYVRRENVIPYIMGCNITTFIDTLFAAALVTEPMALTVVAVQMLAVLMVSVVLLLFVGEPFERAMLSLADRATSSGRNTAVFGVIIVVVPLVLTFL